MSTALNYSKKLHTTIVGESQGVLIKAFRQWKGESYIPKNVHKAICWSKHNPWNESEIFEAWFVKTKDNKQDSTSKPYKFIADESNNKKHKLEKIDKTMMKWSSLKKFV